MLPVEFHHSGLARAVSSAAGSFVRSLITDCARSIHTAKKLGWTESTRCWSTERSINQPLLTCVMRLFYFHFFKVITRLPPWVGSSINVRFRLRGIKTQISSYLPQNSVGCHLLAAVSNLQKRTTGETRRNRGTRSFGARLDAPWYAAGVTTKRTNSISFPIFILISLFSAYLCIPLEKDWIRWRKKKECRSCHPFGW